MLRRSLLALVVAAGPQAPPLRAEVPAPRTHRVEIQGFVFVPSRLEVRACDVVEWTNRDLAPHTATDDDGTWGTKAVKHGASSRIVATAPGLVAYHCAFHPRMTGAIVFTP